MDRATLKSKRTRFYRSSRKNNGLLTKIKSTYSFKKWHKNSDGERIAIATKNRLNADLISTCYFNYATGTKTVHSLALDLDCDKADDKWKVDGALDWGIIGNHLLEQEPAIFRAITYVAKSTSGRGLGVAISISPLELVDSTKRAQVSAFTLQSHIISILNNHGLGADPAAIGLVRDMPNWLNPEKLIDFNEIQKQRVDNSRVSIVTELLKYTNQHSAIRYAKKSEREDLLWPHETTERKLARLFLALFNELSMERCYCFSELIKLTKLSENTLYKVLATPLPWLKIERISKYEGYKLNLLPSPLHYARAENLLSENGIRDNASFKPSFVMPATIKAPCDVEDGERNEYLTSVVLTLKHGGVAKDAASEILSQVVAEIPAAAYSRNCRAAEGIVRSIYKNKPTLFGIKGEGSVPLWLLINDHKNESIKKFKKGISVAYSRATVGISGEREQKLISEHREFEGSALIGGGDAHEATQDTDDVLRIFGSILPNLVQALKSRIDTKKSDGKISFSPILALAEEPREMELNFREDVTGSVPVKKHQTRYAKNLKDFSSRHPLDRFEAAFNRLFPRYGAKTIYEKLVLIHQEIVRAGHKEKYQGRASDYVTKGDPFRRIVMAFLIMSFSMQREILRVLVD